MLSAEHDVSSLWRVGVRGGYNMRAAEAQDVAPVVSRQFVNDLNRDQALLAGWLSYRFTNELSARAEYRFSRNSFSNELLETVYTNGLFFTLSYDGTPRVLRGF